MASKKCDICGKTAYPIEAIREGDHCWHKLCFRCSVCKGTLTLKNFKLKGGQLYCSQHYPTESATAVADDVTTRHAQNAPQKKAEGLSTVYKGDSKTRKEAGDFSVAPAESSGTYESHEEAGHAEEAAPAAEEGGYYEEEAAPAEEEGGYAEAEEGYEEQY